MQECNLLKVMSISNISIDEILTVCPTFCGTFSANNAPPILHNREYFSIVCNLSNEGEKGSHFVTIIAFPSYVYYIDSFGKPSMGGVNSFLSRLNRPVFFNTKKIQDVTSNSCGLYSILFVLFFNASKKFRRKNPLTFSNDLSKNEQYLLVYVKKYMKIY